MFEVVKEHRSGTMLVISLLCLSITALGPDSSHATVLRAEAFPLEGQTEGLQPQILDFRYAPSRWQTCIGLPDDPHKSIVGSDGGFYYDYGGGPFYDFKTRLFATIDAEGPTSDIRQSLLDPRIPIVMTEQDTGNLTLQQQAWARAPEQGQTREQWSQSRADHLWIKMINKGPSKATGRIAVQVDAEAGLVLNKQRTNLVERRDPKHTFCTISPACTSIEYASAPDTDITIDHAPGINLNWAKPKTPCDPRFQDILVGWSRPLVFTYRVQPSKQYRVVLGLIEGHHSKPGIRPLEIRIEGRTVRSVDLVAEYGQNQPAVLCVDAHDQNNDGLITMGVYSPEGAQDKNTILSALWIFEPTRAPNEKDILAGGIDSQALAVTNVDKFATQGNSLKLFFEQRTLDPGEQYQVLLTLYRGPEASAQTPVSQAQNEHHRATLYWRDLDLPYDRITVPDPKVQALLDSCIRNIYQAREIKQGRPAFQVGPTCYRGTWAADGPFILEAITYLGRANETRAGLQHQVDQDQGPGGVAFSKKSGLRLWMIWRHAQLTGHWQWLEKMWPRVQTNVGQIVQYRQMTREDPDQANYGLMPVGFGDGGLGGQHREYTNVYWTLAGLKAAIEIAEKLQKPELPAWKAEFEDYWKTFDRARNRDKLTDDFGNTYVPVTMTGEAPQLPQRGAWAFLQSVFPGRIFDPGDQLMLGTMAMLDATEKEGLIYGTGWLPDGLWNYAASFYAHAHLWLGHGNKAAATLYAFGNHASTLLCWREEQNLLGQKENYCGDMHHNWASAEFIRLVRHMLILERDKELHLLHALPSAWTKPGKHTELSQIPTSFGTMDLVLKIADDGNSANISAQLPRREPLDMLVVHLEHFNRPIEKVSLGNIQLPKTAYTIPTDKHFLLNVEFGS